jgi:hypothetical protein
MAAPMPRVPPVTTATRAISSSLGRTGLAYWSMIFFRKPVPTPHQVRGRLFRDHAPRRLGHPLPQSGRRRNIATECDRRR